MTCNFVRRAGTFKIMAKTTSCTMPISGPFVAVVVAVAAVAVDAVDAAIVAAAVAAAAVADAAAVAAAVAAVAAVAAAVAAAVVALSMLLRVTGAGMEMPSTALARIPPTLFTACRSMTPPLGLMIRSA